jgi:hypothetical protein
MRADHYIKDRHTFSPRPNSIFNPEAPDHPNIEESWLRDRDTGKDHKDVARSLAKAKSKQCNR